MYVSIYVSVYALNMCVCACVCVMQIVWVQASYTEPVTISREGP